MTNALGKRRLRAAGVRVAGAVDHPPFADPQPGDVLDVKWLGFVGHRRHHAARPTASTHLRCTFSSAPEPDCEGHVAIGGADVVARIRPAGK
jgi:hypothetical protein